MKAVVFRLALALLLGAPTSVVMAVPAAASDCYYGNYEDYRTSNPLPYVFYSSDVYYTIGYSCGGYPQSLELREVYESYAVSRSNGNLTHSWNHTLFWESSFGTVWDDNWSKSCNNACSMSKGNQPYVWSRTGYDYSAQVLTSFVHCGVLAGSGGCVFRHYFLQGRMDLSFT